MSKKALSGAVYRLTIPKTELLEEWPVEGDLVVPVEQLPENLLNSMGDRWRQKVRNNEVLEQQNNED